MHTWYNSSVTLYIAEAFFVSNSQKTVSANMIANYNCHPRIHIYGSIETGESLHSLTANI